METTTCVVGIEGGGTTWVAVEAHGSPTNIVDRCEWETTEEPAQTLLKIRDWIGERCRPVHAFGVATFGPVDADPSSPKYGFITATPKPGWKDTDVLGLLGLRSVSQPVLFDTDVNAPAVAEYKVLSNNGKDSSSSSLGKEQGKVLTSCAYITVGTGVGVGLVVNGKPVHGLMHPEAGHIRVPKLDGDEFQGNCPFHDDCIEGMCGSRALSARSGVVASELVSLKDDHPVWVALANQLAHLCCNLVMIVSVEHIAIGGGVMNRKCLFPMIRDRFMELMGGYISSESLTREGLDSFIGPSTYGSTAGIVGACSMAYDFLNTM